MLMKGACALSETVWSSRNQTRQFATMERVIDTEQPDLIVFAGDVIASARTRDPIQSFHNAVAVAEENHILWAAVSGNHDSEGSLSRKRMHEVQLEHEFCLAEPDPPNVSGAGNYVASVLDQHPVATINTSSDVGI